MWGRPQKDEALTERRLETLVAELDRGLWRHVRAFRLLSRARGPETSAFFLRVLAEHPSGTARASVLRLMPRDDADARRVAVHRALGDAEMAVRMAAASILTLEGDSTALPLLADAVRDAVRRTTAPGIGPDGVVFDYPHIGEAYLIGCYAKAIAAISGRGAAPARIWALSFLQGVKPQLPYVGETFQEALELVERAAVSDLPRPASAPDRRSEQLPIPGVSPTNAARSSRRSGVP